MVHHLLIKSGAETPKYRCRERQIELQPNEWTIRELAEQIGMPQPTLYNWIQNGRLPARIVPGSAGRAKLIYADPTTIAALKEIRATPVPWRRLPPKLAHL
jgi:excisionase family DNA binding protein